MTGVSCGMDLRRGKFGIHGCKCTLLLCQSPKVTIAEMCWERAKASSQLRERQSLLVKANKGNEAISYADPGRRPPCVDRAENARVIEFDKHRNESFCKIACVYIWHARPPREARLPARLRDDSLRLPRSTLHYLLRRAADSHVN